VVTSVVSDDFGAEVCSKFFFGLSNNIVAKIDSLSRYVFCIAGNKKQDSHDNNCLNNKILAKE
jgi:hypothetical protein